MRHRHHFARGVEDSLSDIDRNGTYLSRRKMFVVIIKHLISIPDEIIHINQYNTSICRQKPNKTSSKYNKQLRLDTPTIQSTHDKSVQHVHHTRSALNISSNKNYEREPKKKQNRITSGNQKTFLISALLL